MRMRILYNIILHLAFPWIFLRLYIKGRELPAYRERWSERVGSVNSTALSKSIWIHAASVGETVAATPLVEMLRLEYPDTPIVFTTMTPTGSDTVLRLLSQKVRHSYIPYDFPHALKRFWSHHQPRLLILMERELWPNLLELCAQKQVPVVLANARLSARSASEYRMASRFMRRMLSNITMIVAQSDRDAERFMRLGASQKALCSGGNIKCNVAFSENLERDGVTLRQEVLAGQDRSVWIAASTHEGEESVLLRIFRALKKTYPNLLLLLVPRHPERFEAVAHLCVDQGYVIVRRSLGDPCVARTDIFLGDTMGELMLFYAASDIAFVGGSLVPVGGHNMVEPAALGLPIITGRHVFNSTHISDLLQESGALTQAHTPEELEAQMRILLQNPRLWQRRGRAGQATIAKHSKALECHMEVIRGLYTEQ